MPQRRELVLITNQYPFAVGDSTFVQSEIPSLAREFHRIYVWTASPPSETQTLGMPPNVIWMGSLTNKSPISTIVESLRPRNLLRLIMLCWAEIRERGWRVQLPRLLRSAATAAVGGERLTRGIESVRTNSRELVVYSFWGTDGALALITLGSQTALNVVRLHGYDLYEERDGYLPFRRQLFKHADMLLTVSAHGQRYLREKYGDTDLPPVSVARLGTWDHGPGAIGPTPRVRVVSCSSLVKLKRVDMILGVLEQFAGHRSVEWVHFGDGPMRGRLEELAAGVTPRLKVLFCGDVPHAKLMEYYSSKPISAFLNLSSSEGLPMSIMEALSFDIPVLATDVGGTAEIVGPHIGSGMTVPASASVTDIAVVLERLLELRSDLHPRRTWEGLCRASTNGDALAVMLSSTSR